MRQFHEIINERRLQMEMTVEDVHEELERRMLCAGKRPPALATLGHWFNGTRKRPRDMEQLRGLCDVLELQLGEAMGETSATPRTDLEHVILKMAQDLSNADQELAIAFLARLGGAPIPRLEGPKEGES